MTLQVLKTLWRPCTWIAKISQSYVFYLFFFIALRYWKTYISTSIFLLGFESLTSWLPLPPLLWNFKQMYMDNLFFILCKRNHQCLEIFEHYSCLKFKMILLMSFFLILGLVPVPVLGVPKIITMIPRNFVTIMVDGSMSLQAKLTLIKCLLLGKLQEVTVLMLGLV